VNQIGPPKKLNMSIVSAAAPDSASPNEHASNIASVYRQSYELAAKAQQAAVQRASERCRTQCFAFKNGVPGKVAPAALPVLLGRAELLSHLAQSKLVTKDKNVETGVAEPPSGINTRGWPEAASPTLPVLLGRPCQSSFALPEKAMHTDVAEPPRSIGRLEESVSLAKQSLQAFLASKNHRASRSASLSGELHGMDSIIQDADEVRRPLLQANAYRKEKIQRGKEYTSRLTVCTESSRDQAFIPAYASVASSRWCQVLFGILASLLFLSKALGCTAPASP